MLVFTIVNRARVRPATERERVFNGIVRAPARRATKAEMIAEMRKVFQFNQRMCVDWKRHNPVTRAPSCVCTVISPSRAHVLPVGFGGGDHEPFGGFDLGRGCGAWAARLFLRAQPDVR